jgi:hypothetical protein
LILPDSYAYENERMILGRFEHACSGIGLFACAFELDKDPGNLDNSIVSGTDFNLIENNSHKFIVMKCELACLYVFYNPDLYVAICGHKNLVSKECGVKQS